MIGSIWGKDEPGLVQFEESLLPRPVVSDHEKCVKRHFLQIWSFKALHTNTPPPCLVKILSILVTPSQMPKYFVIDHKKCVKRHLFHTNINVGMNVIVCWPHVIVFVLETSFDPDNVFLCPIVWLACCLIQVLLRLTNDGHVCQTFGERRVFGLRFCLLRPPLVWTWTLEETWRVNT